MAALVRQSLLFLLVALTGCAVLDDNFRAVEPHRFYRSGQMRAEVLEKRLTRYGIRTVINLRGAHPEQVWYSDELRVCAALGVAHHDLEWRKEAMPTPESLDVLLALFDSGAYPMLVHCQAGVHRAAVASSCYLLQRGTNVREARGQIGFFFLGAPIGNLLDLYEGSDLPFDRWVSREYPRLHAAAAE